MKKDNSTRILVVEDEYHIRLLLVKILTSEGYQCEAASNGQEAIRLLRKQPFHLIVSDIMMPEMSGIELLKIVNDQFPDVAVMLVTAVDDRSTATKALERGAYAYVIKPFNRNDLLINVANSLERRRHKLLSEEHERILEKLVAERTREIFAKAELLRKQEEEVVLRLLSSISWRDDETGAHAKRIGLYSEVLAKYLGWKTELCDAIRLAAPMHDLGKIGIPDSILQKPGKLTDEEYNVMKHHTEIGARILDGSEMPLLQLARDIALSHHEKWDGSGYPKSLTDTSIPECGRIVAVVDVYDALVHKRVYRPAMTEEKALDIMRSGNGKHFDPRILECFLNVLPEMQRIRLNVTDEKETSADIKQHLTDFHAFADLQQGIRTSGDSWTPSETYIAESNCHS